MKRDRLYLVFDQHIDALSTKAIALEDICNDCGGSGERDREKCYYDYGKDCPNCDGHGVVLNDNGNAIIELMSRYTKSKDSDVLLAKRIL